MNTTMSTFVYAVDKPELPPLEMPDRFQNDIRYFITQSDDKSLSELPSNQYDVSLEEAARALGGCEGNAPHTS